MTESYRLHTMPGSGGMIVEAAFAVAGIPVNTVVHTWDDLGWNSETLNSLNPLGQVPILILPDGQVLTESAAMILHLSEQHPGSGLAPHNDHPDRPKFLRWLIFLVSAVYPTFTYGDVPERWVEGDADAAQKLVNGTNEHRKNLLGNLEREASAPWFLGEIFSALDLYLVVMRHWRPGTEWFEMECPKVHRLAVNAAEIPSVKTVIKKHFPDG